MSNSIFPSAYRIIVFDELASMGELVAHFIQSKHKYTAYIQGTAQSIDELVAMCEEYQPDIVIFEPLNSELLPLEIVEKINHITPRSKLLAFTRSESSYLAAELRKAGVCGVVTQKASLLSLVNAIRDVGVGSIFCTEEVDILEKTRLKRLTSREKHVVNLVAQGFTSREIATQMGITSKTVDKFRQSVMLKLGAHDTVTVTRIAIAHGLACI